MKLIKNCVIIISFLFVYNVIAAPLADNKSQPQSNKTLENVTLSPLLPPLLDESRPQSYHRTETTGKVLISEYKYDENGGYHYEYADSLGKTLIEDAISLTTDGTYPPDLIINGRYTYVDENGVKREGSYVTTENGYRPIDLLEEEEPPIAFAPPPFLPDDEGEIDQNALKSLIG